LSTSIRKRRPEDIEELVEVLLAVRQNDGYPAKWPEDPVSWLESRRTLEALVAERDGGLVGQVELATPEGDFAEDTWRAALDVPEEPIAVIKRLFVAPSVRREGLGRLLLSAATDLCHKRGARPVLDVDATAPANRLYAEEGFKAVGEVELAFSPSGRTFVARCYIGPPPRRGPGQ
jgi:GNAT superfamily N-acetyltransferase